MVFASVLLVKQHLVADILPAILLAELGQVLAPALHLDRLLERVNGRVLKKVGGAV